VLLLYDPQLSVIPLLVTFYVNKLEVVVCVLISLFYTVVTFLAAFVVFFM